MEMKCEACDVEINPDDRVVAAIPEDKPRQDHSGGDPFAGTDTPLLWHEEDWPGPGSGYREVGRGSLNELIHQGMLGRYL